MATFSSVSIWTSKNVSKCIRRSAMCKSNDISSKLKCLCWSSSFSYQRFADPLDPLAPITFSRNRLSSNQLSTMLCGRTKSKLKFSVVLFTFIYGIFKALQFSVFIYRILSVILNDDCQETCGLQYFEMAFIACVFIPLTALLYGVIKVNSSDTNFDIFHKCFLKTVEAVLRWCVASRSYDSYSF